MNNTIKKAVFFFISLIIIWLFPILFAELLPLSAEGIQILAIFIAAILLWLTVGIDWTSIFILLVIPTVIPSIGIAGVMSASLGNNTIAFLIFSCILTYALSSSGFLRRAALWFVNSKIGQKSHWHFAFMYFLSILIIGSFIAPTVLFVLYFALAKEIYEVCSLKEDSSFAKMLMIGTAIFTSISCAMTPIAHTFPLMAIGFYETATGEIISWGKYMLIGIPVGILLSAFVFGILYLGFKKKIAAEGFNAFKLAPMGKVSLIEKESIIVFGLVVVLWLIMGIAPNLIPGLKEATTTAPPMFGIVILCALGALNFKEAITKGVPWQSIILCAATLVIGKYLTSADFGITDYFASLVAPLTTNASAFSLILIVVAFAIIMTNLMSNIVTTTVAYNILTPIIITTGLINPQLSTILIGMAASLAFATPPAIAHIALAAGSGYADSKDMLKYGGLTSVAAIVIVTLLGFAFKGVF